MGCTLCNTTGVVIPFNAAPPLSFSTGDVNPLGGAPLSRDQILVRGPSNTLCTQPDGTTGPRTTVVSFANRASWPRWITYENGRPVDNGTIPGGCWQGTRLPDITVTAGFPWWLWLLLLLALFYASRRR